MEMYVLLKILVLIALGGLFMLMFFAERIRLNSKEKGGRNIVILFGVCLAATLFFSVISMILLNESISASLNNDLMPVEAQIFLYLGILSFVPALIAAPKVTALLLRRKQKHA
jgi:predicted Co/Zn/Cd cation transporter (cation efflux family)